MFYDFVVNDPRKDREIFKVTEESLVKRCTAMLPVDLVKEKSILDLGSALGAMGHWSLSNGAKKYTGVEIQDQYRIKSAELLKSHSNWNLVKTIDDVRGQYDIVIAAGYIHGFFDCFSIFKTICNLSNDIVIIETHDIHVDSPVIVLRETQMIDVSDVNRPYNGLCSVPSKQAVDLIMSVNGFDVDIDRIYPEKIVGSHDGYNTRTDKDRFISRYKKAQKVFTLEEVIQNDNLEV